MFGRFLVLAAGIAVVSVGVAGVASRVPGVASDSSSSASAKVDSWAERGRGMKPSAPSAGSATSSSDGVRIGRAGDSHFYADANIDGTNVRMMVDSGASIVALTRADAEAIGIDVDGLAEAGFAETAGGRVAVRPVMLASIEVDGIEVRNVQAAVIDADMPHSLLGQSFLAKLGAVNVEGDTMTLR